MSPGFTGTLSGQLIEPSQVSYNAIALSANLTLAWPNLSTTGSFTANIIEVTPSAGSLSIIMPDATQRSIGQQVLFRNMTGTAFTVKDNAGGTISNIAANTAIFIYLVTNATAAGSWSLVTFGTGTSSADSASLAGAGLKAIGITLNQKHDVLETTSNVTIDSTFRAQTVVWTSGSMTCTLPTAASVSSDFFFIAKNGGAGSITFTPSGADTIDGASSLVLAPNDAAMFFSSGSSAHWYTVGIGHSVTFAFTQLVKNVAGSADVTLTSAECANKVMKFTGALTGNINVIVTNTVSVYYIFNSTTGAFTLTIKTAAGTGYAILQGSRDVVTCDATNVDRSVSNTAATTIFPVGSAASPSVTFTGRTDTGLYSPGVGQAGISAVGVNQILISSAGISLPTAPLPVASGGTALTAGTSGGVLAYTASGVLASSAALSANQLVLGGGAGVVPATLGSLGTTTTILHGNAGGAPTFAAVSLTADVSNVLPVANGGTALASGTSGGILGYIASGTLASSAALTANAVVVGGGAGATPVPLGSLGTSGQLLQSQGPGTPPLWATVTGTASADVQTFTGGGTWTKPANAKVVVVFAVGAGGGGAGGAGGSTNSGSAGGGGAAGIITINAADVGVTETVTVGAGGTSGAGLAGGGVATAGGAGGSSSFGSWLTMFGGGGGAPGNSTSVSGGGGGGWGGVGGAGASAADSIGGTPQTTANSQGISGQGSGGPGTANVVPKPAEWGGGAGGGGNGSLAGATSIRGGGGGGGGGDNSAGAAGGQTGVWNASGGGGGAGGALSNPGTAGSTGAAISGTLCGMGGGGGGSGQTATNSAGGNGGNGGAGGGGGGGGGMARGTSAGGNGGVGGRGEVRVYTFF